MKKIVFTIVVISVTLTTTAQVRFGVKGGLNLSNLSKVKMEIGRVEFPTPGKNEIIAGLLLGGYVNYGFTDLLAMQVELMFSMQGATFNISSNRETVRLNYINIPMLIDVKPVKPIPISLLVGPQFGFCVGKFSDGKKMKEEQAVAHRDFDFSVALGVQYTFIEHLALGVRYNIGITPSRDVSFAYEEKGDRAIGARNNVLQLSVGWTF
ncbi:MAG: PorT family protein [Prevotellaceae bacterium]|nr:PorT family protein [Prevotellaceae bacterium]